MNLGWNPSDFGLSPDEDLTKGSDPHRGRRFGHARARGWKLELGGSEPPIHQLTHQIAAALLEARQFVGLQSTDSQACHLVDVAPQARS